jgi:hypothetical protein
MKTPVKPRMARRRTYKGIARSLSTGLPEATHLMPDAPV